MLLFPVTSKSPIIAESQGIRRDPLITLPRVSGATVAEIKSADGVRHKRIPGGWSVFLASKGFLVHTFVSTRTETYGSIRAHALLPLARRVGRPLLFFPFDCRSCALVNSSRLSHKQPSSCFSREERLQWSFENPAHNFANVYSHPRIGAVEDIRPGLRTPVPFVSILSHERPTSHNRGGRGEKREREKERVPKPRHNPLYTGRCRQGCRLAQGFRPSPSLETEENRSVSAALREIRAIDTYVRLPVWKTNFHSCSIPCLPDLTTQTPKILTTLRLNIV